MTVSLPRVELARPSDEGELMDMCWQLHSENGLFPMSEGKVRSALRMAFDKKGGIVGIIRPGNVIEGAILLIIASQWYTDEWHLEELFNWVRPEYRKSNNAKALIDFAKTCAPQIGLPLTIGVLSNTRTKAKVELYRRRLGEPSGAFFVVNSAWDETKTRNSVVQNGQQN